MTQNRWLVAAGWMAVAALVAGVAGCRIHVDKDKDGSDKRVQVDTPFGGVHVNTDQTQAADLGLPVYPGAEIVASDDDHQSADVHMGFGDWQLRVRTVSYAAADPEEKVVAFYKKALSHYGDVLTCRDHQAVGEPKITREGLSCEDDEKNGKVKIQSGYSSDSHIQLKAGSKRHQHIVGFESPKNGKTRFALVALDLPASGNKKGD